MSDSQQPLVWKDFDSGIAPSPLKGHGLFRNVDIDSYPGAMKTAKQPGSFFHSITERTFTADAGTDTCTASGTIEADGKNFSGAAVYFTTTGTLPAGLSTGTAYFLYYSDATHFQVCASYKNSVGASAGTVINITDAGTGTHTMHQIEIGTIKHIVKDPRTSNIFMISDNGRVWFKMSSGTRAYLLLNSAIDTPDTGVTAASGGGLAISPFSSTTKTFLFVFRNALIDVIDVYGTTAIETPSWSNAWQSMNTASGSSNSHEAIKGQDDAIYFCDDRWVGSIIENVGSTFDPATGGTFTYNNQALDLPAYEVTQCLEELGSDLLIGSARTNKIYPWDRISSSFGMPIPVPERVTYKLKNLGGTVYILAGTSGNIYKTQGTYVKQHVKLPIYITNNAGSIVQTVVTWGGIEAMNGDLLVGAGTITTGNSGVWRITESGRITIDNVPSGGNHVPYAIYTEGNEFYIFGYDGGADTFSSEVYGAALYTNYQAVAQSPLYSVGTNVGKATYSRAEIVLDRIATAGRLRLSYRSSLIDAFTTIGTVTYDGVSNILPIDNIGLINLNNIQLQAEMNDGATGTADFIVTEIRLFP